MRRSTPKPIRNKLDLSDRVQMRLVRKRLGLSDAELVAIAGRIGNSISAISKEVAQHRASAIPEPAALLPAAVIALAATTEPATEIDAAAPAS